MEHQIKTGQYRKSSNIIVYDASWGSCGIYVHKDENTSHLKEGDIVEFIGWKGYAIDVKFIKHREKTTSLTMILKSKVHFI